MALHLYRSNRTEALLEQLYAVVGAPLPDPFQRETVVVQGRGMERWLAMALAREHRIWANPDFTFPRDLILRAFDGVLGPVSPVSDDAPNPYEPDSLTWVIAGLLPRLQEEPGFEPIRRYLDGASAGSRRALQLSARIARVFDAYVVYRPDWVLASPERVSAAWPDAAEESWQPRLWGEIVAQLGPRHIAARAHEFVQALRSGAQPEPGFPARVSLFGITALAPLYVEAFAALSTCLEVHLFALSPSEQYWADIRSKVEQARAEARSSLSAEELHLEEGNALLASLGALGRDFQIVLEERAASVAWDDTPHYAAPASARALELLQADILALDQGAPQLLEADDRSVQVHACHSPMREVEVLRDQLLRVFEQDRTLVASDVVVMCPDIETYAPLVEAVFGAAEERPNIPFRIADRSARVTAEVADAFLKLLRVLRGRLTALDVIELLASPSLRARFGIDEAELSTLQTWIEGAGVRWGEDEGHRAELELPPFAENSWRFGLDRLLLGYAMPGDERVLFAGVLPYDHIEGKGAEPLGRLIELCEALFDARRRLGRPRSVEGWERELGHLLERMFRATDDDEYQHLAVLRALETLARRARAAGFDDVLDLDTVATLLEELLVGEIPPQGFLSGGVTFCELVPMRSIPFRVVCLMGMGDEGFPRVRRPLGFDLMARKPRPGDRSARDDDRYLFLEALLAARERLLLTYVGRSVRDDSELPPSVVVAELLDALEARLFIPDERGKRLHPAGSALARDALLEQLLQRHPLQPFSPSYFSADEPALFSYARVHRAGAEALLGERVPHPPYLEAPLALPDDEPEELVVTIDELARFFKNPARLLLQRRLGLYLSDEESALEEREPVELDNLERYTIADPLVTRALRGESLDDAYEPLRGAGRLPHGRYGRCVFDGFAPEATAIAELARELAPGDPRPPLEIDLALEGGRVTGLLRDLWPAALLRVQYAKLTGHREVALWIAHLCLNSAAREGDPRASRLIGRASGKGSKLTATAVFEPVEEPEAELSRLLGLYRLGRQAPLPFFVKSAWAYMEELHRANDDEDPAVLEARAITKARAAFDGSPSSDTPGEGADPYIKQLYGGQDPLAPGYYPFAERSLEVGDFADCARAVLAPLFDHRSKG